MTAAEDGLRYQARRVRRLSATPDMRDVRIVHELDGIAGQVQPAALLQVGSRLWEAWCRHPGFSMPDLLFGLDAGGIVPTVAVALASGLPYQLAWKLDLDLPDKHQFIEPHARRTRVFAYGDLAGARVLLIDDEVTTGRTLASLATVLRDVGAQVAGAACLVEDSAGNPRPLMESLEVPLCVLTRI
jgi:adenine phosphoribosyltransferase